MRTAPICGATKAKQYKYISMKKKLLILPLLLLSALFSSCSMDDPTEDEFVINFVKLASVYDQLLDTELTLSAVDVDVDYTTYIENASKAFEKAKGSISLAFNSSNDVTSDDEKELVDGLIEMVEAQDVNLVITVDNRPKSCVVKDEESGLSFQVTYTGDSMYVEEL